MTISVPAGIVDALAMAAGRQRQQVRECCCARIADISIAGAQVRAPIIAPGQHQRGVQREGPFMVGAEQEADLPPAPGHDKTGSQHLPANGAQTVNDNTRAGAQADPCRHHRPDNLRALRPWYEPLSINAGRW